MRLLVIKNLWSLCWDRTLVGFCCTGVFFRLFNTRSLTYLHLYFVLKILLAYLVRGSSPVQCTKVSLKSIASRNKMDSYEEKMKVHLCLFAVLCFKCATRPSVESPAATQTHGSGLGFSWRKIRAHAGNRCCCWAARSRQRTMVALSNARDCESFICKIIASSRPCVGELLIPPTADAYCQEQMLLKEELHMYHEKQPKPLKTYSHSTSCWFFFGAS